MTTNHTLAKLQNDATSALTRSQQSGSSATLATGSVTPMTRTLFNQFKGIARHVVLVADVSRGNGAAKLGNRAAGKMSFVDCPLFVTKKWRTLRAS